MKTMTSALALVGIMASASALAQEPTVLRLNSIAPPTHWFTSGLMVSWQEAVAEATDGRVIVEATDAPLGPMPRAMDMVAQGVADISPGNHGPIQGRFGVTQILDIPFLATSSEAASVAFWRVNEEYLSAAGEHDDVVVLSLWASSPGNIFMVDAPIAGPQDMNGQKMVVVSSTAGSIAQHYGAVTLNQPTTEWYETLSRGVADGVISTNTAIAGWPGLIDIMQNMLYFPDGMHYGTFFLVMNRDAWDGLSQEDQEAIMSVSGETFAAQAGARFQAEDTIALEAIQEAGVSIVEASPAMITEMRQDLAFIEEEWLEEARAAGVDADAALAMFREIVETYEPAE